MSRMANGSDLLPSTKSPKRRFSDEELAYIQAHPLDTAAEIAEALGRSKCSVDHARSRYGRADRARMVCWKCEERPVWRESRQASEAGMCKGCWLDEVERRLAEEPRANAVRQARHRKGR